MFPGVGKFYGSGNIALLFRNESHIIHLAIMRDDLEIQESFSAVYFRTKFITFNTDNKLGKLMEQIGGCPLIPQSCEKGSTTIPKAD